MDDNKSNLKTSLENDTSQGTCSIGSSIDTRRIQDELIANAITASKSDSSNEQETFFALPPHLQQSLFGANPPLEERKSITVAGQRSLGQHGPVRGKRKLRIFTLSMGEHCQNFKPVPSSHGGVRDNDLGHFPVLSQNIRPETQILPKPEPLCIDLDPTDPLEIPSAAVSASEHKQKEHGPLCLVLDPFDQTPALLKKAPKLPVQDLQDDDIFSSLKEGLHSGDDSDSDTKPLLPFLALSEGELDSPQDRVHGGHHYTPTGQSSMLTTVAGKKAPFPIRMPIPEVRTKTKKVKKKVPKVITVKGFTHVGGRALIGYDGSKGGHDSKAETLLSFSELSEGGPDTHHGRLQGDVHCNSADKSFELVSMAEERTKLAPKPKTKPKEIPMPEIEVPKVTSVSRFGRVCRRAAISYDDLSDTDEEKAKSSSSSEYENEDLVSESSGSDFEFDSLDEDSERDELPEERGNHRPTIKETSVLTLEIIADILQTTIDKLDSEMWNSDIQNVHDVYVFEKVVHLSDTTRRYKCYKCEEQIHGTEVDMAKHMRESHLSPLAFGCFLCPLARPNAYLLKVHEKLHMYWNQKVVCTICDANQSSHPDIDWRTLHQLCHPPMEAISQLSPEEQMSSFTCVYPNCKCSKESFCARYNFIKHLRVSHVTGDHVCEICGETGMSIWKLKKHVEGCARKRKKSEKCKLCGGEEKIMYRHDCTGKYDCKICGTKFTNGTSLNRHTRLVHGKGSAHPCDVCGREFTLLKVLEDHMNTHTGAKPYQCLACGGWFTSQAGLAMHLRSRHDLTTKQMREKYKNCPPPEPVVELQENGKRKPARRKPANADSDVDSDTAKAKGKRSRKGKSPSAAVEEEAERNTYTGRKRGRPKKQREDPTLSLPRTDDEDEDFDTSTKTKQKRGGRKKSEKGTSPGVTEEEAERNKYTGRKRGRPKKQTVDDSADSDSQGIGEDFDANKEEADNDE